MVVIETLSHVDNEDFDSNSACSTPFVSAPSSPGRGPPPAPGYFFSAPSSPMHFFLSSSTQENPKLDSSTSSDFEFDFSSRLSSSSGPLGSVPVMTSAEELFSNGQIKPMQLSSHLQNEGGDVEVKRGRELKLRSRSVHRKARSLSPLRNAAAYQVTEDQEQEEVTSTETTPSCSASSSRSSSYSRNSKKWLFLTELLHRSKSEGRANGKEKFWSNISFSPLNLKLKSQSLKEKKTLPEKQKQVKKTPVVGKPTNGIAKRRGVQPSAHELHYKTNRAQAEEMKKRTYLPYRHGLFGCLGFSSKGYSALNGLARSLNPVSSG